MPESDAASKISEHYHTYPYPNIPLIASIPKEQLWQINFEWLAKKNGIEAPNPNPSIWIAGCGTFQPYTLAQANPTATILATDLSESSLKIAKKRCFLHGKRNTDFSVLDLNRFDSYPDEKFDWIECYGVLMSVKDPVQTLNEFKKRLNPGGFIRIMVYPHYGRQRIFQIQEIARLLNLKLENQNSPKTLKKLMTALPDSHPLKYAFFSYEDSRNKEGIADAFLHPNDRAFTGYEICKIIDEAGLEISSNLHRPWGQPKEMAEKLGLAGREPAFCIHYLDLWQSMRSNFVFCLRKKNAEYAVIKSDRHALLDLFQKKVGLKHRMHIARLAVTGSSLQTRTEEDLLELTGSDIRKILFYHPASLPLQKQKLFPGYEDPNPLPHLFFKNSVPLKVVDCFLPQTTPQAVNPLYRYLMDAYTSDSTLPNLSDQISSWGKLTPPLENALYPFGLTPLGTYVSKRNEIESWLQQESRSQSNKWDEVELLDELSKFKNLNILLNRLKISPPTDQVSNRKLWVLLLSHLEFNLPFQKS